MTLNRVSPNTAARQRERRRKFCDRFGRDVQDARILLGEDPLMWPRVPPMKDPRPAEVMHALHGRCWVSWNADPEAHHMGAGSRGRRDYIELLVMLSPEWHAKVNTPTLPLAYLLWLKWHFDWVHCDWHFTARALGHHLPWPEKLLR